MNWEEVPRDCGIWSGEQKEREEKKKDLAYFSVPFSLEQEACAVIGIFFFFLFEKAGWNRLSCGQIVKS